MEIRGCFYSSSCDRLYGLFADLPGLWGHINKGRESVIEISGFSKLSGNKLYDLLFDITKSMGYNFVYSVLGKSTIVAKYYRGEPFTQKYIVLDIGIDGPDYEGSTMNNFIFRLSAARGQISNRMLKMEAEKFLLKLNKLEVLTDLIRATPIWPSTEISDRAMANIDDSPH